MAGLRLGDAVTIVREFLENYGDEFNYSSVPPIKIPELISASQKQIAENCGAADFKIVVHSVPGNSKELRGIMLQYPMHAVVLVSSDLNRCWTRFTIAKEIAHILAETNHLSAELEFVSEQLREAFGSQLQFDEDDVDMDMDMERLCFYIAGEILVPWCMQSVLESKLSSGMNNFKIADFFGVPEKLIETMLDEPYRRIRYEINTELD